MSTILDRYSLRPKLVFKQNVLVDVGSNRDLLYCACGWRFQNLLPRILLLLYSHVEQRFHVQLLIVHFLVSIVGFISYVDVLLFIVEYSLLLFLRCSLVLWVIKICLSLFIDLLRDCCCYFCIGFPRNVANREML